MYGLTSQGVSTFATSGSSYLRGSTTPHPSIMSKSSNSIAKARPVETVTPLPGFCYVEESLARCSKATRQHIPFLRASFFGAFVNVSGDELNMHIQKFANENYVPVHNVFNGGQSPLTRNVSIFEEFMKSTLELIFRLTSNSPVVLIIGSPSHSIDCIIVACLRRVQEWSFVSILGELRMHSGCRQFDIEQFIESFDPDIVDVSQYTPDYIRMHIRLKNEEEKLLIRLDDHSRSSKSTKKDEEMFESDVMVGKLFFSSKLMSLSPGIQFDPSLSLINDKDDDD